MKKLRIYTFVLPLISIVSCNLNKTISQELTKKDDVFFNTIKDTLVNWHLKDYHNDSIPGISFEKAYQNILKKNESSEAIIAILDTDVDIHHEFLKKHIWLNQNEKIDGNDNDKNGYIDDINGWNFISDSIGNSELFVNYEYTRILKKYDSVFEGISDENVSKSLEKEYFHYKRAKDIYLGRTLYAFKEKNYIDYYLNKSKQADIALASYFPEKKYTKEKVDSLIKVNSDPSLLPHLNYILTEIQYNITDKWLADYKLKTYERINKLLNKDFDDRVNIGDDIEDLEDMNYGSYIVNKNSEFLEHGTTVAGVISSLLKKGNSNIKLMVLCVSSLGDENDKDMALAIRYAVNNGAKVINISSGKNFSLHSDWVIKELKNAEEQDVLVVTSAGNSNTNLDEKDVFNYPDDTDENREEVVDNFLKVSSSSYQLTKKFKEEETAYGKTNVDLFAPGEKIFTASAKKDKKYELSSGTSMAAALTSGVAGLIYSYFPSLSVKQVKKILMDSGTSYDINIEVKQRDGSLKLTPFSELSKSGKVLNSYNALLMAEKMTK
ncbi:S8 family serine peptidase [Aquimarina litoralis]|uniref:S8 family serine peptidase n=1 Tax=Aquimarina litoralis TaxID=584605 RepID=UPI001C588B33|nr:S8 family serine peptidase [Aquimarina litoralis]MBW1297803.1 S8 family serine peptidase [Aquimarina litoralis]